MALRPPAELKLTPNEEAIYVLLADGKEHSVAEVIEAVDSPLERQTISEYMGNMRKKLEKIGETVVGQSYGRRIMYRRVRLLRVSTDDT